MAENEHTGSGDKRAGRAHSEEDAIEHDLAALAGDAVEVDEHGLKLNLGLPDEERNAPAPLQATPEELSALAAVEAELDTRWPETKIDPSRERIEYLLDLLGNPQENCHVIHDRFTAAWFPPTHRHVHLAASAERHRAHLPGRQPDSCA